MSPSASTPANPSPLADLYCDHVVVLFFYPKDGTAICTKEACAFRDSYEEFTDAGATVVGVSSDSAESHQQFADQHRLPFLLAADSDGALRKAFGVPKTLGLLPGRVTYVIDRQGFIRAVFSAQLAAQRHVQAALDAISQLS
jgi:peroxiredoxin Q/BCP